GTDVLLTPPDVFHDTIVTIIAEDECNNSAYLEITVMDEGPASQPGDILMNELAWAGTLTSAYDEYIELINTTDRDIFLSNWIIENAAGPGIQLMFSGKIKAGTSFLISNYTLGSEKTALTVSPDFADPCLSLPNSTFGPFVLKNYEGDIFDTVGDGGVYPYGINSSEAKASMARYTYAATTIWDPDSWYTETQSVNLADKTYGTPGAPNSDQGFHSGPSENDALAIITEYYIDYEDPEGPIEDWVELYITRSGNVDRFMVTDLDGKDSFITNEENTYVEKGNYIVVAWGDNTYIQEGNTFFITDYSPTGTKDELVLLCRGSFVDGLCYYSTEHVQFDDEDEIKNYGWKGDPIYGKHASRKKDQEGYYLETMEASSWAPDAEASMGEENNLSQ
ncbi:MAG: lamin tail domain-containing protein, partial [Spirochaetota bacterium]